MNNKGRNNVENKISKYDSLFYKDGPVSFADYSLAKMDNIHYQMYIVALNKYKEKTFNDDDPESDYRFIEIKPNSFYEPSIALQISKRVPYKKKYIDLSNYWPEYIYSNTPDYSVIKMDIRNDIIDSEVIAFDYTKGMVKMRNKISNAEFYVPFSRIDRDTPVSENMMMNDTFQYLISQRQR